MSWTRGAVVGERYRLEAKVGAGGMGEVWAAEHIGVGTRVAMKTLLKATAKNHEMGTRLKREAYFLGRIRSDHVARVLDFIDDDRWGLVLVMEFVDGDKLSDVLMQRRQLSVEETVEIGADLASALSDLHRANVIHRDLKPANVILKPVAGGGRRAMIVDFGLSRLLQDDETGEEAITGITGINMALGTVEYMAPEQVLNSRDVTAASDLYALGALLYRAVAGKHVFGELRDGHMAHAKITREAPLLETGRGDRIARGLESVVAHALARRPADRYDRADLMVAELTSLRDLARLSAIDLGDDTEEGIDDGRLFELRKTMEMAVTRLPAAMGDAGSYAEPPPSSQEASTLRFQSRQATLRIPLGAATSSREALASAEALAPDPDARITQARRGRQPALAPAERSPEPEPVPVPVPPRATVASAIHARASFEGDAPAPVPRMGISPALAIGFAAAALVLGFAAGRVSAPAVSAPAPVPLAPEAPAAATAAPPAAADTQAAGLDPTSEGVLPSASAAPLPAGAGSARAAAPSTGSARPAGARGSTAPGATTTAMSPSAGTAAQPPRPPRPPGDDPYQ